MKSTKTPGLAAITVVGCLFLAMVCPTLGDDGTTSKDTGKASGTRTGASQESHPTAESTVGASGTLASSGPFAAAIARAEARTVKIYGGKIGREPGYATGLIVSGDGQILTSSGALLSADEIRVVLPDGSHHAARVLRRSPELSVALLKIDAATPDFFDLAQPAPVRQGDWLLAVSNAFNVAERRESLSVTLGVLSLKTRLEARRGVQDFDYAGDALLLDCITSNPGAAGGAVVDVEGRLLGMVGKIIESKSTGTRLNYAVPAELLDKFFAGQPLSPPPAVEPSARPELGLRLFAISGPRAAPYVDRVLPGSPAAAAGLKPDDLILEISDESVRSVGDYQRILKTLAVGKPVVLRVKRKLEILEFTLRPVAREKEGTRAKEGTR